MGRGGCPGTASPPCGASPALAAEAPSPAGARPPCLVSRRRWKARRRASDTTTAKGGIEERWTVRIEEANSPTARNHGEQLSMRGGILTEEPLFYARFNLRPQQSEQVDRLNYQFSRE